MRPSAAERFDALILPVQYASDLTPCWGWQGGLDKLGYARIRAHGRRVFAHRYAYERYKGPIPAHLEVHHVCANRACVNPNHLEAVTHRENCRRSRTHIFFHPELRKVRTACKHGHELTSENTRFVHGRRECRTCRRLAKQRDYRRRKQALRDKHERATIRTTPYRSV